MSLATRGEEGVYAASCFYCFDPTSLALVFASEESTTHMRHITADPHVAGTIAPCEIQLHKIQGVQFRGIVHPATPEQKSLYLQTFPIAKAIPTGFWSVRLAWVKMTDNTLGFKTKLLWPTPQPDGR